MLITGFRKTRAASYLTAAIFSVSVLWLPLVLSAAVSVSAFAADVNGGAIPNGGKYVGICGPNVEMHAFDVCCPAGNTACIQQYAGAAQTTSPSVSSNVSNSTGGVVYINIINYATKQAYVTIVVDNCQNILATCGTIAHNQAIAPRMTGHFMIDPNDPDQPMSFAYRYTAFIPGQGSVSGNGSGGSSPSSGN